MSTHDDFAVEEVPGLPKRPPAGEAILWQGAPDFALLAIRAFHVRKIALWFAALGAWRLAVTLHDGGTVSDALRMLMFLGGLGLIATGFFVGLAYAIHRTTVYTITSRRVVMRFGVALPITINLPFAMIEGASLRAGLNGFGDIPLAMKKGQRVPWLILFPHARPWHLTWPQPMLRGIPDAARVAGLLARAFSATAPDGVILSRPVSPSHGETLKPAAA